jgi:hypothetical protein
MGMRNKLSKKTTYKLEAVEELDINLFRNK